MLTGNKKGEVAEIPLEDDEPHVIKEMLRYLYTGQYNDEVQEPGVAAFPPLLLHVHLHTVGDKYDIPDLCHLAQEKFVANAGDKWDTTEFAEAIAEMYETSPDTKTVLHKTVVEVASKHAKELYTSDAGQRFREVASETPKFMSELFSTLVIKQDLAGNDEARYACLDCQRTIVMEKMEGNRRYRCSIRGVLRIVMRGGWGRSGRCYKIARLEGRDRDACCGGNPKERILNTHVLLSEKTRIPSFDRLHRWQNQLMLLVLAGRRC